MTGKMTLTIMLAGLLACGASALAAVTNGGFQDNGGSLDGWSSDGTVDVETADDSNYYAVFKESGSGGLSMIYQDSLTFSTDSPEPSHLRFRFALISDSQERSKYTPPGVETGTQRALERTVVCFGAYAPILSMKNTVRKAEKGDLAL